MKLTDKQVVHVSNLAQLPITGIKVKGYAQMLTKILDHAEKLQELKTENVEPTYNVSGQQTILRGDKTESLFAGEEMLRQGHISNGYFKSKVILKKKNQDE